MRFLRNLLGSRNPTRGWVRDPARALVLDLDSNSLSGVPLGATFGSLEFLGPARRSKSHFESWEFSRLGVVVEVEAERIVGVLAVPIPDELFAVDPYAGSVRLEGRAVSFAWISREQDVVRAFGEPSRRDEDDEETVLFYEGDRVERQIELTPEGRIKTIAIFRNA